MPVPFGSSRRQASMRQVLQITAYCGLLLASSLFMAFSFPGVDHGHGDSPHRHRYPPIGAALPRPTPEQRGGGGGGAGGTQLRQPGQTQASQAQGGVELSGGGGKPFRFYTRLRLCPLIPPGGALAKFSQEYKSAFQLQHQQGGPDDNTAQLTQEDIARWRGAKLYPLEQVKNPTTPGEELWNAISPWIMHNETYPDPICIEFQGQAPSQGGPRSIGRRLAEGHPKAGVVSMFSPSPEDTRNGVFDAEGAGRFDSFDRHNFISVRLPKGGQSYEPLFRSCHLFNTAFLLGEGERQIRENLKGGSPEGDEPYHTWLSLQGMSLLPKVVNMTRFTFVELPSAGAEKAIQEALRSVSADIEPIAKLSLGDMDESRIGTTVFRISLRNVRRGCRKTWSSEEVQWGRSTQLSYDSGTAAVSFKVVSKKKSLGRSIHPMAYLPHFNLETLNSLGLTHGQKVRFLGQQLSTSRFPDPMPHNWVWTGGGLRRIDQVDRRYESEVNETATYWGKSNLGYITLLTDNLCLPKQPSGFPASVQRACMLPCGCCVQSPDCSYAPICRPPSPYCTWGQPICKPCLECAQCLFKISGTLPPLASRPQCPFDKYKTWGGAVKVWNKWKKEAARSAQQESWSQSVTSTGCSRWD
eukprot:TRINITY_DN1865_c1_g1_i1.p1 TRINITY_DN1865_c1_g1~~TRINITY_DN1865_c1_g1_i1.p1  ORF type:complete len:638 (+),score=75.23 TRINITY_DN1865_c1_g1_i1:475-2388(+)